MASFSASILPHSASYFSLALAAYVSARRHFSLAFDADLVASMPVGVKQEVGLVDGSKPHERSLRDSIQAMTASESSAQNADHRSLLTDYD